MKNSALIQPITSLLKFLRNGETISHEPSWGSIGPISTAQAHHEYHVVNLVPGALNGVYSCVTVAVDMQSFIFHKTYDCYDDPNATLPMPTRCTQPPAEALWFGEESWEGIKDSLKCGQCGRCGGCVKRAKPCFDPRLPGNARAMKALPKIPNAEFEEGLD